MCTHKSEIRNVFSEVRSFSYTEKKSKVLTEEYMNKILDAILDFKKEILDKTKIIYDLNSKFESLTWFNDLDEECLMMINDIISISKDAHLSLIHHYIKMNFLRTQGIAKEEIKDFKNAIDEFKESFTDLESVFFHLPKLPEFIETTRELDLISK
jgi:hypothetical protein